MKIAFAHMFTLRTPRGIERYIINVANAMSRKGHDVTIIAGRCPQSPTRSWLDERVKILEVSHYNWHKISFVPSFFRAFLVNDFDVLNLALARAEGYAAGLASKVKRLRYNIIFHYPYEDHEKHYHAFRRFGTASGADRLYAVSDYVARGAEKCFGRPVQVVPSGVDQDRFRPDREMRSRLRRELRIPESSPVLLTVSALQGRKGLDKVLRAVQVLKQTMPDVRYLVVGDGNEKDRLAFARHVKDLDLASTVLSVGSQNDVAPFYQAADLFVFLPEFEAFGLVAIEAMSSELPLVVSQGNAFPEILSRGGGVMVEQDSPETVAALLASLLKDTDRRRLLGRAGRDAVLSTYTWDVVSSQLIEAFERQLRN